MLLAKIKLAVLEGDGDLRRSTGDVGECKLRRDAGPSLDLAAVLRRMASCRFMEGEAVMAGGDFFVGEMTAEEEVVGTKMDWDLGRAGSAVTIAGGEVDGGEVDGGEKGPGERRIRDLLMGF